MVCFKYLFSICQSNLLHHDVHIQILEEQPARSGGGQEAEGTLAAVPQPDAGVAALTSVLPLHADKMALVQNFHLLYPRAHTELLGGVEPWHSTPTTKLSTPSEQAPALLHRHQATHPASRDSGPQQGISHHPPPFGFYIENVRGRTPSWSS